jgi:hypothetical protein
MNVIKEFLTVYEQELGYKIPNAGKEAKGAKRILDAGYTADDAMKCYRHFKKQKFWQNTGQHLSLTFIASNIAPYMQIHDKKDYGSEDLEKWYREHNK